MGWSYLLAPFVRRLMAHCDFVNRSLLILSQYCDLGLKIAEKLPIQAVKTDYSLKSARSFFQITAILSYYCPCVVAKSLSK